MSHQTTAAAFHAETIAVETVAALAPAKTTTQRSWIALPIGLAFVALMAFGAVSNTLVGDMAYVIAQPGL